MTNKVVWVLRDLFFTGQASLGTCYVFKGDKQLFKSESLERGWVNNKNRISCIPEGDYTLVYEWSHNFKTYLWELYGVDGRRECKFHAANFWWQLNGCIALGNNRKYIDGDSIMDVTSSRNTMRKFHKALKGQKRTLLHVRNVPNLFKI